MRPFDQLFLYKCWEIRGMHISEAWYVQCWGIEREKSKINIPAYCLLRLKLQDDEYEAGIGRYMLT